MGSKGAGGSGMVEVVEVVVTDGRVGLETTSAISIVEVSGGMDGKGLIDGTTSSAIGETCGPGAFAKAPSGTTGVLLIPSGMIDCTEGVFLDFLLFLAIIALLTGEIVSFCFSHYEYSLGKAREFSK